MLSNQILIRFIDKFFFYKCIVLYAKNYFYSRIFLSFSIQVILRDELIKKISLKSKNYLKSQISLYKINYKVLLKHYNFDELTVHKKNIKYSYEPKSAYYLFYNQKNKRSVAIKILKSSLSFYIKKLDNLYGNIKFNYGNQPIL